MHATLSQLRNRLIVSCQPVPGSPLDTAPIIAALALAAEHGGAAGLRIEGVANVRAVRAVSRLPLIGLVKRDLSDSPVRITPWREDVRALVAAGADIVAVDATQRERPCPVHELITLIAQEGALSMADCASLADGEAALAAGADVLGSTLSGYTTAQVPELPDLALVSELAAIADFVIAEGRYHQPQQAADAIRAGADSVVVGSAITRPEHVTGWFARAVSDACESRST